MIRDQLWAEALHAYSHGEEWWLSQEQSVRAAEEARVYETEDVTADELLAYLAEQKEWPEFLTARDVARKVLTKIPGQMTPQEVAAINRTMASLGWKRERKRKDGTPQWHFRVPSRGVVFPS